MTSFQDTPKPFFIDYQHWLKPRTTYQKFVLLSIIWEAQPHLFAIRQRRKNVFFKKNCSWDEVAGRSTPRNSFLCISDVRYKPECLFRWLNWQLCPKDEDLFFLSFWTNKYINIFKYYINISLILVILLYSWVADVNISLMITESYLELSRTATMFFLQKWKVPS